MLPLPFEFDRPSTIADAVRAVRESGDGMFYSGGTELLLAMKMRVVPSRLLRGSQHMGYESARAADIQMLSRRRRTHRKRRIERLASRLRIHMQK